MTAPQERTVAEVLRAAADLIEPENSWGKGEWETPEGCLCAEGAMWKAGASKYPASVCVSPAGKFFAKYITGSEFGIVPDWNDAPERTQDEVVAKLREAAALAESQGL